MRELTIVRQERREQPLIRVEASPGSHIRTVCEEAVKLAALRKCDVVLDFNGIEIFAKESDDPSQLEQGFLTQCHQRTEAWNNSQEGMASAQQAQKRLELAQALVNVLLSRLPSAMGSTETLVEWVGEFASVNDHTGLKFDKQALADTLTAAGFSRGALVGEDPASIQKSPKKMAQYIVGQAIDHLCEGMPMHPALERLALQYKSRCVTNACLGLPQ